MSDWCTLLRQSNKKKDKCFKKCRSLKECLWTVFKRFKDKIGKLNLGFKKLCKKKGKSIESSCKKKRIKKEKKYERVGIVGIVG